MSEKLGLFGVVSIALSGDDDAAVRTDDEAVLTEAAIRAFGTVTGAGAGPVGVHRWPRGVPARDAPSGALERVELPEGIRLETNYTDRTGVPGRIRQARRVAPGLAAR
jgi:oxygen-dependent protoporphyrinogen oxidase